MTKPTVQQLFGVIVACNRCNTAWSLSVHPKCPACPSTEFRLHPWQDSFTLWPTELTGLGQNILESLQTHPDDDSTTTT